MGKHQARIPDPSAKRVRDVVIANVSLTADADDLDIGQADVLVVDADGAYTISGIAGGYEGRALDILNVDGTDTLTLANDDAGSIATNQFVVAADILLTDETGARLIYINSRWRTLAI